jgi:hypothetical protein
VKFHDVVPISRSEALSAFSGGDVPAIADALVRVAFHDEDWRWAQARCLEFVSNDDATLRGVAATCLGHVARIHRRIDLDAVMPAINVLMNDPENAGRARDALDDIEQYATDG